MVCAVKNLVFQGKVVERKKRRRAEGDAFMGVGGGVWGRGGIWVSLTVRNQLGIEGAVQVSPVLNTHAVYLGGFRSLSSVLTSLTVLPRT